MIIMVRKIVAVAMLALIGGCAGDERPQSDTTRRADPAGSPALDARPVVLFLGTSLTAGYGLASDQAFPALVQQAIDSAGLPYRGVNAGVSGETSAGGLRRIEWLLREPVDVLVLELGANDGLRGLDVQEMRRNLQAIIDRTRERYPDAQVVIAGMESPPNMGGRYTSAFRRVFPELAAANDAALIPFLLEGVAGRAALNQPDGIHPTAEGHRRIADTVWDVLMPLLEAARSGRHPDQAGHQSERR
jgi:acyl-CoA thioesterase-1